MARRSQEELYELIDGIDTVMMTTRRPDGQLVSRAMATQDPADGADLLLPASELKMLAAESDFVAVCTQLTPETEHLIDADVIGRMKRGALLVNTSRGGVVDEAAVEAALRDGRLGGVAFDVHEREGDGVMSAPARHPNVVLTPHIGGMAVEAQQMIGDRAALLIAAHVRGRLDDETTDEEALV